MTGHKLGGPPLCYHTCGNCLHKWDAAIFFVFTNEKQRTFQTFNLSPPHPLLLLFLLLLLLLVLFFFFFVFFFFFFFFFLFFFFFFFYSVYRFAFCLFLSPFSSFDLFSFSFLRYLHFFTVPCIYTDLIFCILLNRHLHGFYQISGTLKAASHSLPFRGTNLQHQQYEFGQSAHAVYRNL